MNNERQITDQTENLQEMPVSVNADESVTSAKDDPMNDQSPENENQGEQENQEPSQVNDFHSTGASEPSGTVSGEPEMAEVNEDEDHDQDHEEHHEKDYSKLSKDELVRALEELRNAENVIQADKEVNALKHYFDELLDGERSDALDKFLDEGGEEAEFTFALDATANKFEATYRLLKDKKRKFQKQLERAKEENLGKATVVLEKLREFVDSDESSSSFNAFKDLQQQWKDIGPLPKAQVKNLWANYNALVNLFYDKRSIYFELKELDRKKNLESKIVLCERAESLRDEPNLKKAIIDLNDLHHEFKHIGPVPQEDQDSLWQRFKAASDYIYSRRKEFYHQLKGTQLENLKQKQDIIKEVEAYQAYTSDRIKEWNKKTKEILQLQKKWEAVGSVPKENAKEINKQFWSLFKDFFRNKNLFFKKLEGERDENLKKKEELVKRAEEVKDSEDLEETASILKGLQQEWKDIGPVPEKKRQEIFNQFKKACDHFFEKRREQHKETAKDYELNLTKKQEIVEKISQLAEEKSSDLELLESLKAEYEEIGFVPKKSISSIRNSFAKAVAKFINNASDIEEDKKEEILIVAEFSDIRSNPRSNRKLVQKEQSLRRQISQVENDINLMKTNMEYFADSKNADKLKDQFREKIDVATDELNKLKKQLKILRAM